MKLTREILVSYDIEDNRSRKKIYDGLKDIGLYPIQKSVFVGDVKTAEEKAVKRLLSQFLDKKTDKSFILCGQIIEQIKTTGIGYKEDELDIYGKSFVL